MSKRRVRFQTSVAEEDQSEAMRIFLMFEGGQSGHLNLKQFKQAVAELDLTDKTKVSELFKKIDVDVDFEEFLLLFKFKEHLAKEGDQGSESTMKMFSMFDEDQTGYLSVAEWLQVLKLMGIETTEDEASKLFSLVDANKDGKISVKEFTEYIGK